MRDRDITSDPLILGKRPLYRWERDRVDSLRRLGRYLAARIERTATAGGSISHHAVRELRALDWAAQMLEETPGERIVSDALRAMINRQPVDMGTDE